MAHIDKTIFKRAEKLGFFKYLDEVHNLKDTDIDVTYLGSLLEKDKVEDIHITVVVACAFRWIHEVYGYTIRPEVKAGEEPLVCVDWLFSVYKPTNGFTNKDGLNVLDRMLTLIGRTENRPKTYEDVN